jgi:hypothetical protein
MSWVMPFTERSITGEYGTMSDFRRKNKMQAHSGTDWAPAGSRNGKTLIPAIANGTVKNIQFSRILGWVVSQTAMDREKSIWYLSYCHLKCNTHGVACKGGHNASLAFKFKVGDRFVAGDVSHGMTVGNTGLASSGCHLHATASRTLKGVFGVTADKVDLRRLITDNSNGVVAPKTPRKVAKAILKGKPVPAIKVKPIAKKGKSAPVVVTAEVEVKGIAVTISATPVTPVTPEVAPKPVAPPKPVAISTKVLNVEEWKVFQEILRKYSGYDGPIDGAPGKNTYLAIQRSVQAYGYKGAVDGIPGTNTWKSVQRRLVARGTYEGRIDGLWGGQTFAALREAIQNNKY